MKLALLAYFQGEFNTCVYEWIDATHCKVTVHTPQDETVGSFIAEYNEDDGVIEHRKIIDIQEDTGMNTANKPVIPKPIFLNPITPKPVPVIKTYDTEGNEIA